MTDMVLRVSTCISFVPHNSSVRLYVNTPFYRMRKLRFEEARNHTLARGHTELENEKLGRYRWLQPKKKT